MAEVRATVAGSDGDYALVRVTSEGCGRCHEPGGCCGSNLSQAFQSSSKQYRVLNSRHAKPGDDVVIVIDDKALFRSAVLGYGIPLLGLLLGAMFGASYGGDIGSMIGAVGGLLLPWCIHKTGVMRRFFPTGRLQPYIR